MALLIFILLLVSLIVVHELGHFFVAKFFGIRVDEFGIGFPPRLLKIRWGETDYTFNLLLVGGFVRIFGENAEEAKDEPRAFSRKPRLVQAAVIVAGIVCNLLFAWLALSVGYMVGLPTAADHKGFGTVSNVSAMIVDVAKDSPAQKAGIEAGDTVKHIQTGNIEGPEKATATETREFIEANQNESVVLTIVRDGEEKTFIAKPAEGFAEGKKVLGVQLADVGTLRLPPHTALLEGSILTWEMTKSIGQGLIGFFGTIARGTANFSEVSGPIGIAGIGAAAVQQGFSAAVVLVAMISINLALINVLPIPGLDGGRLLFIAVEGVIRKPISPRLSIWLTLVGFAFLITLMVVVSYHDIARLLVR